MTLSHCEGHIKVLHQIQGISQKFMNENPDPAVSFIPRWRRRSRWPIPIRRRAGAAAPPAAPPCPRRTAAAAAAAACPARPRARRGWWPGRWACRARCRCTWSPRGTGRENPPWTASCQRCEMLSKSPNPNVTSSSWWLKCQHNLEPHTFTRTSYLFLAGKGCPSRVQWVFFASFTQLVLCRSSERSGESLSALGVNCEVSGSERYRL